jgi:aromatic ring-opening dioxygenase catalytic subunit (LigB family)
LSLLNNLDPAAHIVIGEALAPLRLQNILLVGSGMSFHNLRALFRPGLVSEIQSDAFDQWLLESCTDSALSVEQRKQRLVNWENAPHARLCHPREEHLLPLQVCFGAASIRSPQAKVVFNQKLMGHSVSGFLWE